LSYMLAVREAVDIVFYSKCFVLVSII